MTVFLVYALFATTNVVRETYLSITLAERGSIRVDEYLGLHPDLFEIPGRGAYINNNPGASVFGAVPYLVARPALSMLFSRYPGLLAPKAAATYDDPRPNRSKFLNRARERGLDIKLGLAALITQAGLMAPLGALMAWLMMQFLVHRGVQERSAAWWALLYAVGTPMLFRSAFLNQNALLAHLTLGAWIAMVGLKPRGDEADIPVGGLLLAGLLLGVGLACDYSAAPLLLVFGLMAVFTGWRRGLVRGVRDGALFTAGALPPMLLLLVYQQAAFGAPWFPAQRYMPATEYSVVGWNGFFVPTAELLLGNLFDLRYGLLAFCPLLVWGFLPSRGRSIDLISRREWGWILAIFAGLYLFSSANQFASLQWNTGVRYLVPALPLLFLAAAGPLRRAGAPLRVLTIGVTVCIALAISMVREDVPTSLRSVLTDGPTLPIFIVLEKVASGYPALQVGRLLPPVLVIAAALVLGLVWRRAPGTPVRVQGAR